MTPGAWDMTDSHRRQMRGRAGRKGKDEVGETYLCCQQNDLEAVVDLMHADPPQISSCLISDKRRIRRLAHKNLVQYRRKVF
jgi:replicative superfamily II helicase